MSPKYDFIGKNYNATRQADPYLLQRMQALLDPISTGRYLDVGCGTGNYTSQLQQQGVDFTGIDPSAKMLAAAQNKNPAIHWLQGTAEQLPLKNDSFDGALATLTLHHWISLAKGFQEVHRVLKENSHFLIFTSTSEQMKGYWLNHYFPQMLANSIQQMPNHSEIENALQENHFSILKKETYSIKPDLKDQFLYCGKQNPSLYLNEKIRNGISSFSALSNIQEVQTGLKKLKNDIQSNKIDQIINSFNNTLGDYLFILAKAKK